LPLNAPAYTVPLAPIPPVTTSEPVVVLELAVLAVNVTALFDARVIRPYPSTVKVGIDVLEPYVPAFTADDGKFATVKFIV
jgi:hypothetical protein